MTYDKLKKTPEYKAARQEVQALIVGTVRPLVARVAALEKKLEDLESRFPKR